MSERIFIDPNTFLGQVNVNTQYSSDIDVRYAGIVTKPRLHPRLIIRKFRRTNNTGASLNEFQPIIEFNNFILTDANEEVEEKYQITQTFGPDFVFLYGPKPRIFTYSGVLYNTTDKPWVVEWQSAWDRSVPVQKAYPGSTTDEQRGIMSGTNVMINGGIARLEYDGSFGFRKADGRIDPSGSGQQVGTDSDNVLSVREGYLLKMSIVRSGMRPNAASFQLVMLVTNRMDF